jgi:hypothetical protein
MNMNNRREFFRKGGLLAMGCTVEQGNDCSDERRRLPDDVRKANTSVVAFPTTFSRQIHNNRLKLKYNGNTGC